MNDLFLLAVNLTRRCNLKCAHCYLDAETLSHGTKDELSTVEVQDLLTQIVSRGSETMVVLTGGEPLLRKDLEQLVGFGSDLGLSMVVGTNGIMLDEKRALALQDAGTMGIGISLDSLDPGFHDDFRGCSGSWQKALAAMDVCRNIALPFQVHFSVMEENAHEIKAVIDFARECGAHVLNFFFLVCTGRGETKTNIKPQQYENVLKILVQEQNKNDGLLIRARCAPHFKRLAYQENPDSMLTKAQGYEGGGCLAGINYCRITPEGAVTACPYIPDQEGNVRDSGFWDIWDNSKNFTTLRQARLQGKCGECEFRILCGGCRARPKALGGTLMDEDSWCIYQPTGGDIIQPLGDRSMKAIQWTAEAETRLKRVPGFLRKMVRKRAEDHVRELGETEVTVNHMIELGSRRFQNVNAGADTGGNQPPYQAPGQDSGQLVWTREAQKYLDSIPGFLRDGVKQVAEDVAFEEGRLEVNLKLIRRLEDQTQPGRKLDWEADAEQAMDEALSNRPAQVRLFVRPTMESAAEKITKLRKSKVVSVGDVNKVTSTFTAGVQWEPDALRRVQSAPEFIRAGIKKAAEFNARRQGITMITGEHLTKFRNRAMMLAVKRMKSFGMKELNFDAYEIARQRVPRLKDNLQAAERFASIKNHVESHQGVDGEGLGVMDRELINKMKEELKKS